MGGWVGGVVTVTVCGVFVVVFVVVVGVGVVWWWCVFVVFERTSHVILYSHMSVCQGRAGVRPLTSMPTFTRISGRCSSRECSAHTSLRSWENGSIY